MSEKEFFDLITDRWRAETGADPGAYPMGMYLDSFRTPDSDYRYAIKLTKKTCARMIHEFLKTVLGVKDLDWDKAKELKDIYDCRVCANSVAQVYERGIMPEDEPGVFGGDRIITPNEAQAFVDTLAEYMTS